MLDGLVGQLVGNKRKVAENQWVKFVCRQLVGLVGGRQASRGEKAQCFQCLSACRSCRYYVGAVGPTSPSPYGRRGVEKSIPHGRFFRMWP